jgi:mevalonate kinase
MRIISDKRLTDLTAREERLKCREELLDEKYILLNDKMEVVRNMAAAKMDQQCYHYAHTLYEQTKRTFEELSKQLVSKFPDWKAPEQKIEIIK